MRPDKTLNQRLRQRSTSVKKSNKQPDKLVLGSWHITTTESGDLVIRDSDSGEEIILARKQ